MAGPSKASDFNIYQEQFQGGYIETLTQNTDAFNSASGGAIMLSSEQKKGDYEQEAFFASTANIISRQDITSVAGVTDLLLEQNEFARVKVHRKIGPVSYTRKAFKQAGLDPESGSFIWGQQVAKSVMVEKLNSAISAGVAAIAANTAMVNDVTGSSGTSSFTNLFNTLRKFGDANARIAAWVMHSTQFFDLGLDAISNSVDTVVADVLRIVNIPSFGRPIIVSDSASLIVTADTPDSYYVLGLVPGAITVEETENETMVSDIITGLEQLAIRLQGEYAYNLGVKGFAWDIANGGANPDATAIGTGSNWDQVAADDKDTAGVALKCVAAS